MSLLIKLFFIFILPYALYATEYAPAVKGGATTVYSFVKTHTNDTDHIFGGGFNTHVAYPYKNYEFTFSSYIFLANVHNLTFNANNTVVHGSGVLRSVSFGPILKYFTPYKPLPTWSLYLSGGPTWSLQTLKLDNFSVTQGDFLKDYKITYNSRGILLGIGIEEKLPYKEMHPVFFEIIYNYLQAYKVSIVDASNYSEVNILSDESNNQKIFGHILMINMGITIF